jgi:hypothetical protein
MSALKDQVVVDTLERVEVVALTRDTAKWWNARRKKDQIAAFCGWFWIAKKSGVEAGPFRTWSAAVSDAHYRVILEREPPSVGHTAMPGFRRPKETTRSGASKRERDRVAA